MKVPISGYGSDERGVAQRGVGLGAPPFATGGMLLAAAATFAASMAVPVNLGHTRFAVVSFVNGVAFGLFAAPNTTSIVNSVPARHRGVRSGVRGTFQNAGMPISIAVFVSLSSNPLHSLPGPKVLASPTPAQQATLSGRSFFLSLLRGSEYIHRETRTADDTGGAVRT